MKLSLAIAVFCALSLIGSSALAQMGDDFEPPPERQPTVTPMPKKPSAGPHGPRQARPNYDRIELKKTEKALQKVRVRAAFVEGRLKEMELSNGHLLHIVKISGAALITALMVIILGFFVLLVGRATTAKKKDEDEEDKDKEEPTKPLTQAVEAVPAD